MLTILPGSEINDRYVVREALGTGGYGAVWRAYDKKLCRDVALKRLLHASHVRDEKALATLREEAQKIAQNQHPNIIQVYDVEEAEGEPLLVLEFVPGRTLHGLLRDKAYRNEVLPLEQAQIILRGVLSGIACAHSMGICHRDLSPMNILLTSAGEPKIADFGIARLLPERSALLRQGSDEPEGGTGNAHFMSPEQARGERADAASDLFMVGIVGYLVIAGRHPFAHPSGLIAIPEALMRNDFTPETPRPSPILSLREQKVFREIGSVVMRLMHREKSGRYQSAREAIDALDRTALAGRESEANHGRVSTLKVKPEKYTLSKLVQVHETGLLLRNPEYQRGAAWSNSQKAAFIDSLFRSYPVPALFLHRQEFDGLGGQKSTKYEIVDGQQRLLAMRDFLASKYLLLDLKGEARLRIPKSIRALPAPWSGKRYSDLPRDLQEEIQGVEIPVFEIDGSAHPDEIRDLFIRLQSGTALSRQQIRDAWPGALGPFIEKLAGKLDKQPSVGLFDLIDKRGQRAEDEDQKDRHVTHRQTCAQLLKIFLGRERDSGSIPGVSANELDGLYHEETDFDPNGERANRFVGLLRETEKIFREARERHEAKTKFRLVDIKSTVMFLQDVSRNPEFRLDGAAMRNLAKRIVKNEGKKSMAGKSTRASTLREYYEWWREEVAGGIGVRLDPQRAFNEKQKAEIRRSQKGICAVCNRKVAADDENFDHYPVPYRDGGRTEVDNARLVHATCHPRGRPSEDVESLDDE